MSDFDWTGDAIATLKKMWAKGEPAAAIARALGGGLSRSAISGKARRLRLPKRTDRGITAVIRSAPFPAAQTMTHQEKVQALGLGKPPAAALIGGGRHIGTADLKDCHCRWPIGDVGQTNFHYCGQSPKQGSPYCDFHTAKARARTVPTLQEIEEASRKSDVQFARIWG